MSTEVVFINETRSELKTIAGIRYRSISALWLRHWFAFIRFWKYALAFMFVEPVVMTPLRREWDQAREELDTTGAPEEWIEKITAGLSP